MKKIQREETQVIVKDIFVSVDGKEFTNEADCKAWETSYRGTLEASWALIKKKKVFDTDFGIPWSSEDHECYAISPKNLDEITLINAYIKATTGDNGRLTMRHIGQLIILDFGYDHDYCDIWVLSERIDAIIGNIDKLKAEMNDKKEEH